jgi:hypothetical protein
MMTRGLKRRRQLDQSGGSRRVRFGPGPWPRAASTAVGDEPAEESTTSWPRCGSKRRRRTTTERRAAARRSAGALAPAPRCRALRAATPAPTAGPNRVRLLERRMAADATRTPASAAARPRVRACPRSGAETTGLHRPARQSSYCISRPLLSEMKSVETRKRTQSATLILRRDRQILEAHDARVRRCIVRSQQHECRDRRRVAVQPLLPLACGRQQNQQATDSTFHQYRNVVPSKFLRSRHGTAQRSTTERPANRSPRRERSSDAWRTFGPEKCSLYKCMASENSFPSTPAPSSSTRHSTLSTGRSSAADVVSTRHRRRLCLLRHASPPPSLWSNDDFPIMLCFCEWGRRRRRRVAGGSACDERRTDARR